MDYSTARDAIDEYFSLKRKGDIYRMVIENTEKMLIEKALERSFGNQVSAAKILGINRNTIRTKIKQYHIDTNTFKL